MQQSYEQCDTELNKEVHAYIMKTYRIANQNLFTIKIRIQYA